MRNVLITGAGIGIGRATAKAFADNGDRLAFIYVVGDTVDGVDHAVANEEPRLQVLDFEQLCQCPPASASCRRTQPLATSVA